MRFKKSIRESKSTWFRPRLRNICSDCWPSGARKVSRRRVRLGGGTSTSLYKAKALDPIGAAFMLPEVKDSSKWLEGRHHYNDVDNQYVFIYAAFPLHLLGYNPNSSTRKTCAAYADLLDPRWKGKITIKDPRDPGGG